jgi:hypothetical protein
LRVYVDPLLILLDGLHPHTWIKHRYELLFLLWSQLTLDNKTGYPNG